MVSAVATPAADATLGDTTKAKKPKIEVLRKWDSWSKIEIDFPALDTDGDGSNIKKPGSYLFQSLAGDDCSYLFPLFS